MLHNVVSLFGRSLPRTIRYGSRDHFPGRLSYVPLGTCTTSSPACLEGRDGLPDARQPAYRRGNGMVDGPIAETPPRGQPRRGTVRRVRPMSAVDCFTVAEPSDSEGAAMSIKVMSWVYSDSESRLADRLVLLAIADEADDDGTNGCPSLRTIAHKARVSLPTAHAAVARLEALGELRVHRPARTGRGHFNTYEVLMGTPEKGQESEHSSEEETFGNVRKRSVQACTDPQTHRPIEDLTPLSSALDRTDVETVFDAYREATGRHRAVLDPKRRRLIEAALANYEPADLIAAVRGWKHSPHNCGVNDRHTVYNDLGLLLRDAAHIERFRDLELGATSEQAARDPGPLGATISYLESRRA